MGTEQWGQQRLSDDQQTRARNALEHFESRNSGLMTTTRRVESAVGLKKFELTIC